MAQYIYLQWEMEVRIREYNEVVVTSFLLVQIKKGCWSLVPIAGGKYKQGVIESFMSM